MNIHDDQIKFLTNVRQYLTASGREAVDESIERARIRAQIADDYGMTSRI